jgi:hypothetical protein
MVRVSLLNPRLGVLGFYKLLRQTLAHSADPERFSAASSRIEEFPPTGGDCFDACDDGPISAVDMEFPTGEIKRLDALRSDVNIAPPYKSNGASQLARSSPQLSRAFYKSPRCSCPAQIVRRWTRSDESARFLGGLITDAFQLFGAPGMPKATEN